MCMRCMIAQRGEMTDQHLNALMESVREAYMREVAAYQEHNPPAAWAVTEAELSAIPRNVWRMMAFHVAETLAHMTQQEVAVARLTLVEEALAMPAEAARVSGALLRRLEEAREAQQGEQCPEGN